MQNTAFNHLLANKTPSKCLRATAKLLGLVLFAGVIAGCQNTGRYHVRHDSAPSRAPQQISMQDAVPVYEPYAKATSNRYQVFGRFYQPMTTGRGYSAKGEASWYGQKFHGHLTANGEVYDMYTMTAAHKTLPIPSYVRVTNLANQRQVVVRVNDRGPFHNDRIIDLSYAAALKLDMVKNGTSQVKIDVIHVSPDGSVTIGNQDSQWRPAPVKNNSRYNTSTAVSHGNMPANTKVTLSDPTASQQLYLQVAALQNRQKIRQLAEGLANLYQVPSSTPHQAGLYRLRLGPIRDEQQANYLLKELKANGYQGAYRVYVPGNHEVHGP